MLLLSIFFVLLDVIGLFIISLYTEVDWGSLYIITTIICGLTLIIGIKGIYHYSKKILNNNTKI